MLYSIISESRLEDSPHSGRFFLCMRAWRNRKTRKFQELVAAGCESSILSTRTKERKEYKNMIVWKEPDPEWGEITGAIIGGEMIDLSHGENIEGLCNGSTRDFDSLGAGSTPAPSTINKNSEERVRLL